MSVLLAWAGVLAGCGGAATGPPTEPSATAAPVAPVAPVASPSEARMLGLTRRLPAQYRRVCEEQAAYAPAGARACPPLIPAGRLKVMDAAPFSNLPRYRGGYLADVGSASLSELGRRHIETNGGHWHYDVSWTPAVRRLLVRRGVEHPVNAGAPSSCRSRRLDDQRVEACRVVPYEQGGGLNGGHIAYVWTHDAATFVLSVHGYENEPRARAMMAALIASVVG